MVLSTPSNRYDEEIAADVLKQCGEPEIIKASRSLLDAGVLSKSIYDPAKRRPGRALRISDAYVTSALLTFSYTHRRS